MSTPAQIKAQRRNWSKRIITGHTKALKTTLYKGELSKEEHNKILEVCTICESILSEWPKKVE